VEAGRFSQALDVIAAMGVRFEGAEFRNTRSRAATFLLTKSPADDPAGKESLISLLRFFETLGFLYRQKVIDASSAWHFFGSRWTIVRVETRMHPTRDTAHLVSSHQVELFLKHEAALPLVPVPGP
jgi:hypothetical protein